MRRRTSIAVKFCWELGPSSVNFPFPSLPVLPLPPPQMGAFQHCCVQEGPQPLYPPRPHHVPPTHLCNPSPLEPQGDSGLGLLTPTLSSVTKVVRALAAEESEDSLKHGSSGRPAAGVEQAHVWLANGKGGHSVL